MEELTKRLHIKIHPSHYQWIKDQAHKYNKSMGAFVRDTIMIAYMEDHSEEWGREEYEKIKQSKTV